MIRWTDDNACGDAPLPPSRRPKFDPKLDPYLALIAAGGLALWAVGVAAAVCLIGALH